MKCTVLAPHPALSAAMGPASGQAARPLVVAALALSSWTLSPAQTASPGPGWVGRWDLAHADETPDHCPLTLQDQETIGGRQLRLAKTCAQAVAWTRELTAWRVQPDGTLVLADALRHAVIAFKRDETGDLTGIGPDRLMYVLYPERPAQPRR